LIKLPRGTQDILPEQWPLWRHVLKTAEQTAEGSGYSRIDTPMFELTSLFTHATGEHTDVNREMYTFEDRGGEQLSLRPEGTASVFRAYFQHGMRVLPQPVKLYYLGSMFRYERPQSGRFREHHQFGCEAIGSQDPLLDASLVALQHRFYRRAGIDRLRVQVNSIGDQTCRSAYIKTLLQYLRALEGELCSQCRERIERNPLRVLDCKVESCQPVLNQAPRMLDHLCDACQAHWDRFLEGLEALRLPLTINPRLVRGLDYYTRSVWEFLPETATGAQSVLGGGGRYDALAVAIGAPQTPGVGFSTGLERVMLNLDPTGDVDRSSDGIDVFVAQLGPEAELAALKVMNDIAAGGLRVDMAFDKRNLGTQLKYASDRGAKVAVIIGEEELAAGVATVKCLDSREQTKVRLQDITGTLRAKLEKSEDISQ
jgi:histidyl-tRNA synthetase